MKVLVHLTDREHNMTRKGDYWAMSRETIIQSDTIRTKVGAPSKWLVISLDTSVIRRRRRHRRESRFSTTTQKIESHQTTFLTDISITSLDVDMLTSFVSQSVPPSLRQRPWITFRTLFILIDLNPGPTLASKRPKCARICTLGSTWKKLCLWEKPS